MARQPNGLVPRGRMGRVRGFMGRGVHRGGMGGYRGGMGGHRGGMGGHRGGIGGHRGGMGGHRGGMGGGARVGPRHKPPPLMGRPLLNPLHVNRPPIYEDEMDRLGPPMMRMPHLPMHPPMRGSWDCRPPRVGPMWGRPRGRGIPPPLPHPPMPRMGHPPRGRGGFRGGPPQLMPFRPPPPPDMFMPYPPMEPEDFEFEREPGMFLGRGVRNRGRGNFIVRGRPKINKPKLQIKSNKVAPAAESPQSELNKPWVTEAIKNEILKKHKLQQKAKKGREQKDWEAFKEQRNKVTTILREAKIEYQESEEADLIKSVGVAPNEGETCDKSESDAGNPKEPSADNSKSDCGSLEANAKAQNDVPT